jgi:C_GCAxxG_C_C family probable redox protein
MSDIAKKAEDRFAQGFSCAQAVFSAVADTHGLPTETALRVASAFGGGIARRGEACGAFTGAMMALGWGCGHSTNDDPSKERTYAIANELASRFTVAHGSLRCRDLIGFDIGDPAGRAAAKESGVFKSLCPVLVREAAEWANELIEQNGGSRG